MNSPRETDQAANLLAVHAQLRALYAAEYPEGAPHLWEVLLPKLPEYIRALVRRKLDLLVDYEVGTEGKTHANLEQYEKDALAAFFDMQLLKAHMEIGRDSALSNDNHSIAHFDTQPPIIARNLITVAATESPEKLERMGAIFIDVDGTKTIVDCTSHSHAGKYLEGLAKFLCRPPERLQRWLRERALRMESYAVAGDEFLAVVRCDERAVDKQTLDALSAELQATIAEDAELNGHISFDDPEFIMEYDDEWNDEDRAAYKRDPGPWAAKLAASRAKLPDRFTPSVSCGSATFFEALQEALSPDTEEAKTLEELGVNAFRLMVATADARLKADKRVFRENLTDPKWKAFLLRNAENRRLLNELEEVKQQLAATRRRLEELEGLGLVG